MPTFRELKTLIHDKGEWLQIKFIPKPMLPFHRKDTVNDDISPNSLCVLRAFAVNNYFYGGNHELRYHWR